MLNLSDMTSKFRTVCTFVNVTSQTVSVAIFVTYVHTKFWTLKHNCLFIISIKPKAKEKFRLTTILLFYILQKQNKTSLTKFLYFSNI
jgi:hypothetical protein